MNPSDCRKALLRLMHSQSRCIDQATDYLDDIKRAFVDDHLQGMHDLLATPRFDLTRIESLERERHQLLAEFGYDKDKRGFEACIEWCDDSNNELSEQYLVMIEKLKSLQRSIQVNNLLISKGRDRVRRSIGVLTGLTGSDCKTYSSSGQAIDAADRRNLAIA